MSHGIKTGTRRIIRLDELSFEVRRSSRITKDSSCRRIMRPLVYKRPNQSCEYFFPEEKISPNGQIHHRLSLEIRFVAFDIVFFSGGGRVGGGERNSLDGIFH